VIKAKTKARATSATVHHGVYVGGGAFYGDITGLPGNSAAGLSLGLFYENHQFSIGPEYRYLSIGAGTYGNSSSMHAFHAITRVFFGGSEALFVGGGLGILSFEMSSGSGGYSSAAGTVSTTGKGSGPGLAMVAGFELFRRSKVRLIVEARLDLPFFDVEEVERQYASYPSTGSTSKNISQYSVPLALTAGFYF
jgi:hypothetical protein